MNVTIKGIMARPQRTEHGFVWWGAGDDVIDPKNGLIPWHLRNRLIPDKHPPPGRGGAWYYNQRHAIEDLARVVIEVLKEQKENRCQNRPITTWNPSDKPTPI